MSWEIEIREPGVEARRLALDADAEVGREGQDLVIAHRSVSRRHCWFHVTPEGLAVTDLGSANGTAVNGDKITEATWLDPGDSLLLGDVEVAVIGEVSEAPSTPEAAPEGAPPPAPAPSAPTAPSAPAEPALPPPTPAEPAVPRAAAPTAPQPDPGPAASPPPGTASTPVPLATARPELYELASIDIDGAVIRYQPGTAGERAAKGMASAVKKARKKLEGLGTASTLVPQVCLVDPFPDPDRPGQMVTDGTVVDAGRAEIWMVVTTEAPPEPPERPLALLYGSGLPAAEELVALVEGYGLWAAGTEGVDDELREVGLPPFEAAEGELRSAMALSLVEHLIEREREAGMLRLLNTARPGLVDTAAEEIYGLNLTSLEISWRQELEEVAGTAKPGQFVRLSLRYLRPHMRRQGEIFAYMLFALAFTMVFPFVTRRLFDVALPSGEFNQVATLLGALGIAFAISMVASLRQAYLSAHVSGAVVRDVRQEMFTKIQTLSTGWFHRHPQGDVLTRLFSDVAVVEQGLTQTLSQGIFQVISLIVSTIIMFTLNVMLGVVVVIGAPLVAIVYRVMGKGARSRSVAVQEDTGVLTGAAAENYDAQPVVKMFGLQRREQDRFLRAGDRLFRSQKRLSLYGGIFGLSVNMIVTALRLGVLGLGSWLILEGNLTLGGLVAFLGIMGEVLSPVTVLTGIGQELQQATGALIRINEVLDEEPEVAEAPDAAVLPRLSRELRLAGVGFSYTSDRQILDGVEATIAAGSRVAFVGPSGSGKSTVLQLLMRLYDPDEGAILLDGVDLRQATVSSLRDQIGVVFQDNFLFDTTVRENIRLGKPGATDAEVEAAAQAAEMHDAIMDLPNGYDTTVGPRGGKLSGGQRQRVAIARALVRNPQILLLDEATSALDPRTERQINATLTRVAQGRTTITITHRLTSVTDYDLIFVIVDGQIVERGTHDELVAAGGTYAVLWSEQTGQPVPTAEAPFDAVGALARVPIFEGLDTAQLGDIAARLQSSDLTPGDRIADGGGRLSLVARGRAVVLSETLGGDYAVTAELGVGDAFGLAALLGNQSGVMLEAAEPTTLVVLDDEAIAAIAALIPAVADRLVGESTPSAGPAGGHRLTRVTFGVGGQKLAAVTAAIDTRSAGQDVRRVTGSMPRI